MKNIFLLISLIILISCSRNTHTDNIGIMQPEKKVFENVIDIHPCDSIQINEVFDLVGCKIVGNNICV